MPRWIPGQDRQHPWGKTMKRTEHMQFLEPTTSYGHWPCQCGNWTRWNPAKIMQSMVIAKTLTRNQAGNMDIVCIAIHFVGVCWQSAGLRRLVCFWLSSSFENMPESLFSAHLRVFYANLAGWWLYPVNELKVIGSWSQSRDGGRC